MTCKDCIHHEVCHMWVWEICNDIEERIKEFGCIGFYIPTKYLIRVIHSALFVGRRLTGRR